MTRFLNHGTDAGAAGIGMASLIGMLPEIAAGFTVAYYILRIVLFLREWYLKRKNVPKS